MKKQRIPAFSPDLDLTDPWKNGGSKQPKPILRAATPFAQEVFITAMVITNVAIVAYSQRGMKLWKYCTVRVSSGREVVATPTKMTGQSGQKRPKVKAQTISLN